MKIINIALPVALREQGNQFARCIGMGPEDDRTSNRAWLSNQGA